MKRLLALLAVIAATAVVSVAIAGTAGDPAPDGGSVATAQPAPTTLGSHTCGARGSNTLRTQNASTTTSPLSFTPVPSATVTVTVPEGATRCVKVTFSGEAACYGSEGSNFCYVRATDNGLEMHPQAESTHVFASDTVFAASHTVRWVRRAGPGTHTIRVEQRVAEAPTEFFLDDWLLDVEVYT